MAEEAFFGRWESTTIENFDEYMKTLEVGFILRKAGAHATTTIQIERDGEGIRWQYKIAFKSGDLRFKLGEEFDEITPDGRPVKSFVTVEGDKIRWKQTGKPCDTIIMRHLEDDGNTMVEVCEAKGVVCTRKYKRLQ